MVRNKEINLMAVVFISFFIAFVASIIDYPDWMDNIKPDWILLVLIYWCWMLPQRIGVASGFLVGLLTDILYYSLLGQHAFAKTVSAWLLAISSNKMRYATLLQQCIFIFFVAVIDISIVVLIGLLTSGISISLVFWQSAITTCLIWGAVSSIATR